MLTGYINISNIRLISWLTEEEGKTCPETLKQNGFLKQVQAI